MRISAFLLTAVLLTALVPPAHADEKKKSGILNLNNRTERIQALKADKKRYGVQIDELKKQRKAAKKRNDTVTADKITAQIAALRKKRDAEYRAGRQQIRDELKKYREEHKPPAPFCEGCESQVLYPNADNSKRVDSRIVPGAAAAMEAPGTQPKEKS